MWAEIDGHDVLRLQFQEPASVGSDRQLALRHRQRRDTDFRIAPLAGDVVALGPLNLTPGRWDAYLVGPDPDGRGDRVRSVDPGHGLAGLEAYAKRPRSLALRAYRTQRDGHLAIHAVAAPPHAEVVRLELVEDSLVLTGFLAYPARAATAARLIAESRGGHRPIHGGGDLDIGGRFTGRLPLGLLADRVAPDDIDLWLELDGGDQRLPVAARLDGLEDKPRRVRYPERPIADRVAIRPYYTTGDHLAVAVRNIDGGIA